MTAAAADLSSTSTEPAHVLCCGDCAGEVLAAGGRHAPVTLLPPGRMCAIHPPRLPERIATNAIIVPDGWHRASDAVELATVLVLPRRPSWFARLAGAVVRALRPRPKVGPVTEIATRLLVAWSEGDSTRVDEWTIDLAVMRAQRILERTEGK